MVQSDHDIYDAIRAFHKDVANIRQQRQVPSNRLFNGLRIGDRWFRQQVCGHSLGSSNRIAERLAHVKGIQP
jgi:hypothetical protein